GVAHLVDRLGPRVRSERAVTPVLLHPRMEKVLVDGGQFRRQLLVEKLDDARVALHAYAPRKSRLSERMSTERLNQAPPRIGPRKNRALSSVGRLALMRLGQAPLTALHR